MITITKGNPTPEEVAALVAVLILANHPSEPRLLSSWATAWRRSAPFADVNPRQPGRHERRWGRTYADWRCGRPAHAPLPRSAARATTNRRVAGWPDSIAELVKCDFA